MYFIHSYPHTIPVIITVKIYIYFVGDHIKYTLQLLHLRITYDKNNYFNNI